MKITFCFEKKNNIWFAIFMITAIVLKWTTGFPWWLLLLYAPVLYLLETIRLELGTWQQYVWATLQMIGGAWLSVMSIQYMLLEPELMAKTKMFKLFLNILVALCIYLFVQFFTNRTAVTCLIVHPLLLLFGLVDYFVYSFRGNELTFADLKSATTGLSVAANYRFELIDRCAYVALVGILFVVLCWKNNVSYEKPWRMRVASAVLVAGMFSYIAAETSSTNTETWEQKGTYRNGYLLNFCLEIRDSIISAPEGYSTEAVETLEDDYEMYSDAYSVSDVEKPTIIVIMNESFADLSVLGDLDTNIELTPFLNKLYRNTLRGYALSSVYSAKTPNSEWEFLTGNSMAFLPQGSVVYQQYIDEEPNSLVSTMSNLGYTCVAMHPYYETGWSRNSIYPTMGFDEMYFIDDFDQTQLLRKYITDQELYRKIIERFENSPDKEDLFIMSVSMQNHGGYGEEYDNMVQRVYKLGTSWVDVNQYLQLVNESDKALEELITYFSGVDEPVEIVFFGDHQPGLNSKFYQLMNGKGVSGLTKEELEELYTVPFFIWTNYSTPSGTIELTSLNYLSTLALERANIELPAYNQFLAEMQEVIPAINSQGYYSLSEGGYKDIEDAEGEEAEWINAYHMLEYNNMFDSANRSSFFFPYLTDAD